MKQILLAILGAAIVYITYVMIHTGAFNPVQLDIIDGPEYHVVYKSHTGAYHEISRTIEEVEKWLASFKVGCRKSFGQFLDDPSVTEEDRLRSHVGCLVKERHEDSDLAIHYKVIKPQKYLRALFSGSPAIGPMKVYPKAKEFMTVNELEADGPVMEIYTIHSADKMTTEYLFPIK